MSTRNNDVQKVLVTTGNQDVLAAGGAVADLAAGQIGFFNYDTKVAVDETTTNLPKRVSIVVGGTKKDFQAGSYIEVKRTDYVSYRPHTPGRNQKIKVTSFVDAECDMDYSIKIELRDQQKYRSQGYNQYTKTFSVRTPCCVGSQVDVDGNALAILLRDAINADEGNEFSAELIARQALTAADFTPNLSQDYTIGDVVTDDDIAIIIADNEANDTGNYVDIEISFSNLAIQEFCSVNLKYYHPRNIVGIVSPLEDMVCIGATTEETLSVVFPEGLGYDVQQKEYHSPVESADPYRLYSNIVGTAKYKAFKADADVEYDQFNFGYEIKTNSEFGEYFNPLDTLVAVPGADTTTLAAIAAVVDNLFGVELTSDITAADSNPANIEKTEDKGIDDDGIDP